MGVLTGVVKIRWRVVGWALVPRGRGNIHIIIRALRAQGQACFAILKNGFIGCWFWWQIILQTKIATIWPLRAFASMEGESAVHFFRKRFGPTWFWLFGGTCFSKNVGIVSAFWHSKIKEKTSRGWTQTGFKIFFRNLRHKQAFRLSVARTPRRPSKWAKWARLPGWNANCQMVPIARAYTPPPPKKKGTIAPHSHLFLVQIIAYVLDNQGF